MLTEYFLLPARDNMPTEYFLPPATDCGDVMLPVISSFNRWKVKTGWFDGCSGTQSMVLLLDRSAISVREAIKKRLFFGQVPKVLRPFWPKYWVNI